MNVETVAPPTGWRAVPLAVWGLLVIGGLLVMRALAQGSFAPIGTFTLVGPVFFAAAVIYVGPPDKRFLWGAIALALPPMVSVIASWIPAVWLQLAPGDLQNTVPTLQSLGDAARQIAILLGLLGFIPLALALGGIRTFMSVVILAVGLLVATGNVLWLGAMGIQLQPLDFVRNVGFAVMYAMGWGLVFAAALESLRSLAFIGSGLIFANVVLNGVLLWWQPGNSTVELVAILTSLPASVGWLFLIAAALRGELSAARAGDPRSPADRESAALRRAG